MAKKAAKSAKEADKKPKAAAKAPAKKPAPKVAAKAPAKAAKPKKVVEDEVEETEDVDDIEAAEDLETVDVDVDELEEAEAAPKAKVKAVKPKKISAKKEKAAAKALSDATESAKKWSDLKDRHAGEKSPNYAMSAQFEANSPLQHKVLGWGYVLTNNNDRLEVLFESGVKILISNYKA